MQEIIRQIRDEIGRVVVGQQEMIDSLLIGILTGGHILLEGVPGVAKTTTVNTLAKVLGLDFKRVQFTPDLLPGDIIGTEIYDPSNGSFKIKHGPIFTHILLADEINRAPAKVQSALLEVMQEKQATIGEKSFPVEPPFFVLATQNPIEQEGVYALPEAQLDRFMMKVKVGYGSAEDELAVVRRIVESAEVLFELQKALNSVHVDAEVEKYMVELVLATREELPQLRYGASPRASIDLYRAARARAFLEGKDFVSPVDVAAVLPPVLRHRLVLSYEAEAAGVEADNLIRDLLAKVAIP